MQSVTVKVAGRKRELRPDFATLKALLAAGIDPLARVARIGKGEPLSPVEAVEVVRAAMGAEETEDKVLSAGLAHIMNAASGLLLALVVPHESAAEVLPPAQNQNGDEEKKE